MRTWFSSISPGTIYPPINWLTATFSLSPEREVTDHTELELIFESYYADFEEIVAEIKTVKVDLTVPDIPLLHVSHNPGHD